MTIGFTAYSFQSGLARSRGCRGPRRTYEVRRVPRLTNPRRAYDVRGTTGSATHESASRVRRRTYDDFGVKATSLGLRARVKATWLGLRARVKATWLGRCALDTPGLDGAQRRHRPGVFFVLCLSRGGAPSARHAAEYPRFAAGACGAARDRGVHLPAADQARTESPASCRFHSRFSSRLPIPQPT